MLFGGFSFSEAFRGSAKRKTLVFFGVSLVFFVFFFKNQQTRVYPYPLGARSARPNPKMGVPDPENPLFLGFSVLRGGLRPWSQTMVSEGARPWARGRSGDCQKSKGWRVREGLGVCGLKIVLWTFQKFLVQRQGEREEASEPGGGLYPEGPDLVNSWV